MDLTPDFNRLRTALLLQGEPDRVPLWGFPGPGIMSTWMGLAKPASDFDSTVKFSAAAGYDYVTRAANLDTALDRVKKGDELGFRRHKGDYDLYDPADETERQWANEKTGVITTMKQFEAFPWPKIEDVDFSVYEGIENRMPKGMKVIAGGGHIFTHVWELMGMETFSFALADNPELVGKLFEKVGSFQYQALEKATKYKGVGAITMSDDLGYTAGLLIAPKYYRKYLFPWFERICSMCKERGILTIYHNDGKLYEVLDDIVAVGFNGLNPIQANAMDIRVVKERVGKKICLLGGIDMDVIVRGTPAEVVELTKKILKDIAPGGGYGAGSSHSMPDGFVRVENFSALRDTVLKYGTYPIRI